MAKIVRFVRTARATRRLNPWRSRHVIDQPQRACARAGERTARYYWPAELTAADAHRHLAFAASERPTQPQRQTVVVRCAIRDIRRVNIVRRTKPYGNIVPSRISRYRSRTSFSFSSQGREEIGRFPRDLWRIRRVSSGILNENVGLQAGREEEEEMKGMLALAALLGVLSVCRVQVKISFFPPHSLSRVLALVFRFQPHECIGRRQQMYERAPLSPLCQANVRRSEAPCRAIDVMCRENFSFFSFFPPSKLRADAPIRLRPLPWRLSNGPINDRDAAYSDYQ